MTAPQKYNFGISQTVLIRHACAKAGLSWTTALQPDDGGCLQPYFTKGGLDGLPPPRNDPTLACSHLRQSSALRLGPVKHKRIPEKIRSIKDFIFLKTKPSHSRCNISAAWQPTLTPARLEPLTTK